MYLVIQSFPAPAPRKSIWMLVRQWFGLKPRPVPSGRGIDARLVGEAATLEDAARMAMPRNSVGVNPRITESLRRDGRVIVVSLSNPYPDNYPSVVVDPFRDTTLTAWGILDNSTWQMLFGVQVDFAEIVEKANEVKDRWVRDRRILSIDKVI